MATNDRSCPSCGAQVSSDADRCYLCGTALQSSAEETEGRSEDQSPDADPSGEASAPASEEGSSVFCHECGWENPPGANYCSQCGTQLQEVSDEAPPGTRPIAADLPTGDRSESDSEGPSQEQTDEQNELGQQIALVVGGALILVLALFFVTQWSEGYEWSQEGSNEPPAAQAQAGTEGPSAGSPSSAQQMPRGSSEGGTEASASLEQLVDQTAGELSGQIASQVDSLRDQIDDAPSGEKQKLQAKLVNLLIGAGEPGRAALIQKDVAETTGEIDDRRRAADLLYRWMQQLQGEGQRQQVFEVARHAADMYAAVAEERPNDLDARTRMGEAYLLTNEPMQGIKAINAVLEDDSTFVPARFQKGLALLQINRFDQARAEFEKVTRHAEEGSPFYRQAERAMEVIDKQRQSSSQQSSASEGG